MLSIKNLHARAGDNEILRGIDLEVKGGEVHAIMGPNGSGKSTLAHVLAGREAFEVTSGRILYQGKDLLAMSPEERAWAGLFLAFQYPVEIPGVSNMYFLRTALNALRKSRGQEEMDAMDFLALVKEKSKVVHMDRELLNRPVNEGFSGGEKKRNEIFQMAVLDPTLAVLDETDSGLDIDALRVVAEGVNALRGKDRAIILVTHYQRLLEYIVPDHVHVLSGGRIVKSGGKELALELEKKGYAWIDEEARRADGGLVTGTAPAGVQSDAHLSRFTAFLKERKEREPAWLRRLREEGMARFAERGYPTSRDEEWKSTSVAPLARTSFGPAPELAPADAPRSGAAPVFALDDQDAIRLVFVNGRFQPGLSRQDRLPEGVTLSSLAAVLANEPGVLEDILDDSMRPAGHVFAALNDAFLEDGAFLSIPEGKVVEAPIHLVHLTRAGGGPAVVHPRTVIRAGKGSQATVTELHAGDGTEPVLTNAVTQICLADGAVLSHTKVVEEADGAFHVGFMPVRQGRESNFSSVSLTLGGGLVRLDPHVLLEGEGAECTLDGLYMAGGRRHVDNHTVVDHLRPRTGSRQLYKGILDGASRGVFYGRVLVRPDAQKINANQTNKNLILSGEALASSTPQLEIHADDVQCRHGSTIGQLDDDMLFYLRSRGISRDAARSVLTYAFASEILARVRVPGLRHALERRLFPEAAA